eukprot:TRINITY_DN3985_c0_g1_i1.p3 TRINITY_DN3985_c0_g1~~TRINITY_DN3985_c0_g1_i1.p3  ORF type:complete len:128 (+),score=42.72 TRINITY_DN3985_c0_g1_i1:52-384(+)
MSEAAWAGADFLHFVFMSAVTLLSLAVISHCWTGGSVKWGYVFVQLTLIVMILYEFNFVWQAAMKPPPSWEREVFRWDCLQSPKGGKQWAGDDAKDELNPCLCALHFKAV